MDDKEIRNCLKKIAERLRRDYHAEKVILYGSYARGEFTPDSDIDILVSAPAKERFFERMATVRRLIRDLRNGLPVSPIILTPDELETRLRAGDQFIKEIVKKGIAL